MPAGSVAFLFYRDPGRGAWERTGGRYRDGAWETSGGASITGRVGPGRPDGGRRTAPARSSRAQGGGGGSAPARRRVFALREILLPLPSPPVGGSVEGLRGPKCTPA